MQGKLREHRCSISGLRMVRPLEDDSLSKRFQSNDGVTCQRQVQTNREAALASLQIGHHIFLHHFSVYCLRSSHDLNDHQGP